MKLHSLSAFFPCFNEEANIEQMVKRFLEVLPELAEQFEVIIVNDGSSDNTAKIADKLAAKHQEVKVIHHPKNLGYGASLRTGFDSARYDGVFFTDGDMQFDVAQLDKFIPFTTEYNVIIGYRKRRAEGSLRAMNAKLFKLYIDLLFRLHVKDIDCAFKLLRRDVIQSLPLQSTGAFTSAEFLYRLKKQGQQFKQLSVDHFARKYGTPTGNHPRVVIKAGLEALRLYLDMKLNRSQAVSH
jgi:glycosyltransferase involved in cell wall biosynthesis